MSSLVIGLYPTAPVAPATFETYLHDLTITAYQVDFDQPTTVPAPPHTAIGPPAQYTVAGAATNTIYQLDLGLATGSAAGAVIPVAPAIAAQFLAPQSLLNVVLNVTRGGVQLVNNAINYDVQVSAGTPTALTSLAPPIVVGLYLALADPSLDSATYVLPPSDGSPPPWTVLDTAIKAILAEDPAAPVDTANLSSEDCLNIARELVSNRVARPLPQPLTGTPPAPDLATLYTLPNATATAVESDRSQFESALTGYYSQLTGDATRMAGYVYAWSAAQNCQQMSANAAHAALTLPVRLTTTAAPGQQAEATVILGN